MLKIYAVLFISLLLVGTAVAQDYRGTGGNFGSGWTPDGSGGFSGTGGNFGSGWTPDGSGGLSGTGDNFGSGWER